MLLSAILYFISFCAQGVAALYSVNLYLRSKSYRLAFGFLALALCLMLGRRVYPLVHFLNHGHVDLPDALLSLPISLCLLFGMLHLRKLLIEVEQANFLLDQSVKVDALTGALSRTEAFSRSSVEIERSLRNGHPISFLMLDIDHFKNVNDQYGHQVGDAVLINLVKHCQKELRVIDIFGRVGGEEFFIVLPESSELEAFQVAERLREFIASESTHCDTGAEIRITISIGVATFNPKVVGETRPAVILKTFFKKADDAMYCAKGNGRNRCEIFPGN